MAKVLAISSQTVFGPVGNSAAAPALQSLDHEVMQIPTVLLTNHPGHGKPVGQVTPAPLLQQMLLQLSALSALHDCQGVLTGYFATSQQVDIVANFVTSMKQTHPLLHVLVDPVLGDHGALYVAEEIAIAIRDKLLPLATITTPNLFELSWLVGSKSCDMDIVAAARQLGVAEVIVTSVPRQPDELATLLVQQATVTEHKTDRLAEVPHGTGDYLAGLYLANRFITSPETAFARSNLRLQQAITKSAGTATLDLT